MVILKNFLVPKYLQELVLALVGNGWLNWLNTTIRANLRQWLKLPKDTPRAFFHAGTGDGGLGVLSLRYSVPVVRRRRLEAVHSATDPLSTALATSAFFQKELGGLTSKTLGRRLVSDKRSLAQAWADCTPKWMGDICLKHASVWREVVGCLPLPVINEGPITSAINARGRLLYSKVRSARGDSGRDVTCDSCRHPETAQHIIQVCLRTSGPRMRRHDRVVQFVLLAAESAGYKVMVEPRIVGRTLGVRKPDLVLWNECRAYVADVTITSDQVGIGGVKAHRGKVTYYDQP